MAKAKLKTAFKNNKAVEKANKEKQQKVERAKESLDNQGPVTITKDDLKDTEPVVQPEAKASKKALKGKDTKPKKDEEYKSDVLSKKEQRKLQKAISKAQGEDEEEDDDEEESGSDDIEIAEDEDSEMEEYLLDLEKLARSDSESESESEDEEDEEEEAQENQAEEEEEDEDDEEEEEEEDIPLSDVEIDSDADIVPHTKLTINNVGALKNALTRIQLPWEKYSFQEHQSITSAQAVEPEIKDIYDDTQRELAFYKQALNAALQGRTKLLKLKVPFTRPQDYFAEMVKSDEHMDKLKSKLIKEASEKKASAEAKRQRELKKFGKQVQNATLQDRQKQKRETLDKIKGLKRKRQNEEISANDFDVAVEEATADIDERKDRNKRTKPNAKRMAKDSKYGQGGMKRFKRKNDAESSADISGFSQRKMKGKSAKRPGKSKRNNRK
ncbi:unnamed protein product [Wickerhamomyces anomalus]